MDTARVYAQLQRRLLKSDHPPFRILKHPEPALLVDGVSVAGGKYPSPKLCAVRLVQSKANHRFGDTAAPEGLVDEHIAKPGKRALVGDDPGVANLLPICVGANHRCRARCRPFHILALDAWTPIGGRQPRMHAIKVNATEIVIDFKMGKLLPHAERLLVPTISASARRPIPLSR